MTRTNRLAQETSPYLLQHAENPVDWYAWGPEALAKARSENKPILLSVGYSACHWCHVMAHESFEDESTAEVMNRLFVNIKVDREERPDNDKIYQTAHQLITQRPGGWPLTVFLTPDGQLPFFAGTYFPKEERYGMPAFTELLLRVAQYFEENPSDVNSQGNAVIEALGRIEPGAADTSVKLDRAPLDKLRKQLASNFDAEWGGFGGAPKFPHPSSLEFLLRHWRSTAHSETPDVDALYMCALTLTRMTEGGIYDQLGGGYYRYSVDREWQIPHFEKMLYDNGRLLALLVNLWQASGDDLFRIAANDTADWVLRDMQGEHGGFFAALDADSEGEEGKFYVWSPEQAAALLDADEYAVFAPRFGLTEAANFEGDWHLQIDASIDDVAAEAGCDESRARALINSARTKLLAERNTRVWPGCDEKVLTSWNALMIRGLAMAGRTLKRPELVDAASRATALIRRELIIDNRLLASFKDDRARFNAYLDDHAFLIDALLELLQARWHAPDMELAIELANDLLAHFYDTERGGFYFTANDHEALAHRSRTFGDDSLPSGNAIAAFALGRLGHLLGDARYLAAQERTLRAGWPAMSDFPHGHAALVNALDEYLEPPEIVIIRGEADTIDDWADSVRAIYAPRRLVFTIPANAADLPGALAERVSAATPRAYICKGTTCSLPVESLDELASALSEA
jgi:uncharacterized protein YyaL (SSP411 family)